MAKQSPGPSECSLSALEAAPLVESMVSELRDRGFRKTDALVELLTVMTENHQPFTLAQLAEMPGLKDRDQATVYRLITKLRDAGRVRQLNMAGRVSHYQMVLPGHHHDYLICEDCGVVVEAPVPCQLADTEREISATFGWKQVRHELEFFGTCPACAQ